MSQEEKKSGLSRRDFVKSAALVAGASVLMGCSQAAEVTEIPTEPSTATDTAVPTAAPTAAAPTEAATQAATQAAQTTSPDVITAEMASKKWAFELAPDPIPDSEIANTVETEIVIVGAGTSGLVCANSAAESGAKVVLIAASKGNISRGGSNHAMNSKVMQAVADKYPIPEIGVTLKKELITNGYNVDQDKWWKFGRNSEEAMNWLIDKMAPSGYQCVLEATYTDTGDGSMDIPVGSHNWIDKDPQMAGMAQQLVVDYLAKTAADAGVTLNYGMIAVQLVREDNNTGRVTAVIAKGPDGKYTKYVGSKAIVLATGDFSADTEMMTRYCPIALPLLNTEGDQGYDTGFKMGGLYKGDGQKMGLWVGAAWQRSVPNCPMLLTFLNPFPKPKMGNHPGLIVNKNGYRFGNEEASGPFTGYSQLHQPDMKIYAIWGTNFAKAVEPWYTGAVLGDPATPTDDIIKGWETTASNGGFVKADTVEEVIAQLGLPAETIDTVNRYNGYCKSGVDEEYFKRKEWLIPVETGPFYGAVSEKPTFLTVLGGLRTNINMQVCDANDQPIPGLYNIGAMVGDFYYNTYNFLTFGLNLGACCVTFGYLTGKYIAQNE